MAELAATGERLVPNAWRNRDEYLAYLRQRFAYGAAASELAGAPRVLDFGCGSGLCTRVLGDVVDEIVGVDVAAEAVAYASAHYGSDTCSFRVYDGVRLPIDDASFDAAVSFHAIEHIRADTDAVAEIARVLRPGGTVLISTPNRANRVEPGRRPWNKFHVREYDAADLAAMLSTQFTDVRVRGVTAREEVHAIEMARVAQSRRMRRWDVLNLRGLIPDRCRPYVTRLVRRVLPRPDPSAGPADWVDRYGLEDFYLTETDLDDALDLLATARKSV